MRKTALLRLGACAAAGSLALSACGSRSASTSGTGASAVTVTIAFDAPLSTSASAVGIGMENSAQLAVDLANKNGEVPGVTFKLEAKDDQSTPAIGAQNATAFTSDASVVGVVGPYNSSVAQSMQPIFQSAGLVEVSPANTNPTLTMGTDWQTAPKRQYPVYFRTITTDATQGPYAADYAVKKLGIKKVFYIDDGLTYGAGLAATFVEEFTKDGGAVLGHQQVTDGQTDFSAVVAAVKASGANAVYYGGQYAEAGPLKKQLVAAGFTGDMIAGDAVKDPTFVQLAGAAASNTTTYVTSDGVPPGGTAAGQAYVSAYNSELSAGKFGNSQAYGTFGPFAYSAAWAVIEAVKAAKAANGGTLPSGTALRAAVVKAMAGVDFQGPTGEVAFNQYGDDVDQAVTMNEVENGAFTAIYTGKIS